MRFTLPHLLCSFLLASPGWARAQAIPTVEAPATGSAVTAAPVVCGSYDGIIVSQAKPLAGVSVALEGTSMLLITNADGFFTVPSKYTGLPTFALSAAGYAPLRITYTSCAPMTIEMQILPGTRIRKHGKRKGQLKNDGLEHARL